MTKQREGLPCERTEANCTNPALQRGEWDSSQLSVQGDVRGQPHSPVLIQNCWCLSLNQYSALNSLPHPQRMFSRYLDKWVVSTSWEIIKRQLTLKSRWGRQDRVIGIVANHPGVLKQTRSLLDLKMQSQYGLGTQYSGKILKSGFVYRISSFKKFKNSQI